MTVSIVRGTYKVSPEILTIKPSGQISQDEQISLFLQYLVITF